MKGHIDEVSLDEYLVHIYTPPVSANDNEMYPVLYVQDGGSLFVSSLDDYTPWQAPALVEGRPAFGGGGDAYLEFIVTQVMPYVEARYPVQTGPEHTGIVGASLGGLISMYAAFRYADMFGHIGS